MDKALMEDLKDSLSLAINARRSAYANCSKYKVGAVLATRNGKKYTGCNIENSGIQAICAERTAFCKAISEGERYFKYILVVGAYEDATELDKCLPCGYCRQFMNDFVDEDFKIYAMNGEKIEEYTLKELLPHAFKL
jgi:cytidine deaminase